MDDDRSVRDLLQTILTAHGYGVVTADGGWSAIHAFENASQPIDLLLTDVVMPDLSGPVLAEKLRALQPDLDVLFISGFHDSELVQRFASMRGFGLVPKPFTPEALLRAIEACLAAQR